MNVANKKESSMPRSRYNRKRDGERIYITSVRGELGYKPGEVRGPGVFDLSPEEFWLYTPVRDYGETKLDTLYIGLYLPDELRQKALVYFEDHTEVVVSGVIVKGRVVSTDICLDVDIIQPVASFDREMKAQPEDSNHINFPDIQLFGVVCQQHEPPEYYLNCWLSNIIIEKDPGNRCVGVRHRLVFLDTHDDEIYTSIAQHVGRTCVVAGYLTTIEQETPIEGQIVVNINPHPDYACGMMVKFLSTGYIAGDTHVKKTKTA